MSATFMRTLNGGWLNTASIKSIDEYGCATLADQSAAERYVSLHLDWWEPTNVIEVKGRAEA